MKKPAQREPYVGTWTVPLDYRASLTHTPARLEAQIAEMVITTATPEGPAQLLRSARRLLLFTLLEYEFAVTAVLTGLQAIEVALQLELKRPTPPNFSRLIQQARAKNLITAAAAETLSMAVKLRNDIAHPHEKILLNIPIARDFVRASHQIVAELYPDSAPLHPAGSQRPDAVH